jgi:hypothetical protein
LTLPRKLRASFITLRKVSQVSLRSFLSNSCKFKDVQNEMLLYAADQKREICRTFKCVMIAILPTTEAVGFPATGERVNRENGVV